MPHTTVERRPRTHRRLSASHPIWLMGPLAALLVASLAAVGQRWVPTGDWAIVELGVHDAVSGNPPLLGAYSRFGWNHPGPALFWLLAPIYGLAGGQSWALPFGVGLWNTACFGIALLYARRCSPTFALLAALAFAAQLAVLGLNRFIDPWNPTAAVAPFAAVLVLSVAALKGDRAAAGWVLVLASVAAQMHVGYLLVASPSVLVAGVVLLRPRRHWRLLAVVALGLLAVWLPAALDQWWGQGNASRIIGSMTESQGAAGIGPALRATADALTFGLVPGLPAVSSTLVAGVSAGTLWVVARHRRTIQERAFVLATSQVAVGAIATSRISGRIEEWLILWWVPLAAFWWMTVAWIAMTHLGNRREVGRHDDRLTRWAMPLAAVVLVVLTLVAIREPRTLGDAPDPAGFGEVVAALAPAAVELAGASGGAIELRTLGMDAGWVGDGLGLQLEKAGVAVRVPNEKLNLFKWGAHRLGSSDPSPRHQLWVITGRGVDHLERVRALWPDDADLCGVVPAVEPDPARTRVAEAERRLFDRLAAAGRPDLVSSYLAGDPLVGRPELAELGQLEAELASLRDRSDVLLVSVCSRSGPGGG